MRPNASIYARLVRWSGRGSALGLALSAGAFFWAGAVDPGPLLGGALRAVALYGGLAGVAALGAWALLRGAAVAVQGDGDDDVRQDRAEAAGYGLWTADDPDH